MTLHYGIETTEPRSGGLLEQSHKIRVVVVGSIEPRKGQDVLVRSIEGMARELVDSFEFYFVGRVLDIEYHDALKRKTEALTNVHWVGEVSRNESLKYISNSNVVVCTSRDETGPIAVIEGMSLGKAIVSTPVGVVPEIIEHGQNGLLIEIDSDRTLTECLVQLCQDRPLLEKLGNAARTSFGEHLTIERYARDVANVVSRVIDAYRAEPN